MKNTNEYSQLMDKIKSWANNTLNPHYPYAVVMNCSKPESHTYYARHLVESDQGQTLCGLSLKRGHAWALSNAQFVTCQKCQRVVMNRERRAGHHKQ